MREKFEVDDLTDFIPGLTMMTLMTTMMMTRIMKKNRKSEMQDFGVKTLREETSTIRLCFIN